MYTIIKERRKTAVIQIDKSLNIIIKVPKNMSQKEIEDFIYKYQEWINDAVAKKKKLYETQDWVLTGKILFLGEYTPVHVQQIAYAKELVLLNEKGFKLITSGDEEKMRIAMELYLRKRAKVLFADLTKKYAEIVGMQYGKITIRKQETRWGSCARNGNLSYNVKLMCAPIHMIEYVVLHEVMHLRHFNHSKEFWQDIEKIMPDYKERMHYFKKFGQNFII